MISDKPPAPLRVLVLMPMLPGYEAVRKTVATTVADAKLELVWLEDLLEDWELARLFKPMNKVAPLD